MDCQTFAYNYLKFSSAKQRLKPPIAVAALGSSPVEVGSLRVSFQQLSLERTGKRLIDGPQASKKFPVKIELKKSHRANFRFVIVLSIGEGRREL